MAPPLQLGSAYVRWRVASPDTLDQIARNALALQLGDRPLAEDIYADIKEQIIRSGER
ncbi:hypothetical protein ACFQVD_43045 [Streptosporangium amethystogenes subsp. fukuiense]|uniref:Uncharacterized protein n=1 Tax=Streptosporangium amethystogenes subsp. fukuiense TaxID=698418 RepID=A0ABW2TDY5_9ACTN